MHHEHYAREGKGAGQPTPSSKRRTCRSGSNSTIKRHDPTRRRPPGKRGTWRKSATRNEAGEKDCGQHAAHGGWRGTRGFLTRQRRHLVTGGASRASRGRSRASTAALPPAPEASHRAACLRPEDQPRSTTDQVDQVSRSRCVDPGRKYGGTALTLEASLVMDQ